MNVQYKVMSCYALGHPSQTVATEEAAQKQAREQDSRDCGPGSVILKITDLGDTPRHSKRYKIEVLDTK